MGANDADSPDRELRFRRTDFEFKQPETPLIQPRVEPWSSTLSQILIADPDESLLEEYRAYSRSDFEVITASTGVECMYHMRQRAPDILVLEPNMQWGDGHGLLAVMHDVLNLGDVPVMLLTSCSDSVLNLVTRYPICDYHPKPMNPEKLVQRLESILETRTSRRVNFAERQRRLESRLENLIAKEAAGRVHSMSPGQVR